jgi:hypothetical protein
VARSRSRPLSAAAPIKTAILVLSDPRAVLVMDFAGGRALALTGTADVTWSGPDPEGRTGGTGRWWRLRPFEAREVAFPARSA